MFEPTISIALVLVTMIIFLTVIAMSWEKNSGFRSFYIIIVIWLAFLSFNISRHTLDVVEQVNMTKNVYNISGALTSQENTTITQDPQITVQNNNLLDSLNYYWLRIGLFISALEFLNLVTNLSNFFSRGKKEGEEGDELLKPL